MAQIATCNTCGARIVWVTKISGRPLEATPVPPRPGEEGFVVVRLPNGHHVWRDTWDCPVPPAEHLRVHRCPGAYAVAVSLGHALKRLDLL